MEAEAFSEVLRAVRLTGALFFRVDVHGEWVAEASAATDCAPYVLPGAQHGGRLQPRLLPPARHVARGLAELSRNIAGRGKLRP